MESQVVEGTETMWSSFVNGIFDYLDSRGDLVQSTKEEMDREISDVAC